MIATSASVAVAGCADVKDAPVLLSAATVRHEEAVVALVDVYPTPVEAGDAVLSLT